MSELIRSDYFNYFLGICCIASGLIPIGILLHGARRLDNHVKSKKSEGGVVLPSQQERQMIQFVVVAAVIFAVLFAMFAMLAILRIQALGG